MDAYEKADVTHDVDPEEGPPFADLGIPHEQLVWIPVTSAAGTSSFVSMCLTTLRKGDFLVLSATGQGTRRVCHFAELLKQKIRGLHQMTRIAYKKAEEIWTPKEPGLDSLKVVREMPALHVLLCQKSKALPNMGVEQNARGNANTNGARNRRNREFPNGAEHQPASEGGNRGGRRAAPGGRRSSPQRRSGNERNCVNEEGNPSRNSMEQVQPH